MGCIEELMQEKESHINSIMESLRRNPYYTKHLKYAGRDVLMFLDLTNILCQASEYRLWLDLEDLVHIFSTLYNLRGFYAFTGSNLSGGMVNFLYETGYVVYQSPFDSDAIMGFVISDLTRDIDVDLVIMGTHDGGFRGVSDQLARKGIDVAFLGFREMFSSYLRSSLLFCFEDLNILSNLREKGAVGEFLDDAKIPIRVES
jgi:uncharacterized LabA/DUF88 family protein